MSGDPVSASEITVGGDGTDGLVSVLPAAGTAGNLVLATLKMDGKQGELSIGSEPVPGNLSVRSGGGLPGQIALGGARVFHVSGSHVFVGGNGQDGLVSIAPASDTEENTANATLVLDGQQGTLRLGNASNPGSLSVCSGVGPTGQIFLGGAPVFRVNGSQVIVGGNGQMGTVSVHGTDGTPVVELLARPNEAAIGVGQAPRYPGRIEVFNAAGASVIELRGADGAIMANDVILHGADCAEEFDIDTDAATPEPGTVMVLGLDGTLSPSKGTYDRRVAGVVSGAGNYKPGIVLDRQDGQRRLPIALIGKVYCKVDADYGQIDVGDLLTTSDTAGHAMKADDPLRAFGAVLGKALGQLAFGRGLVPILVALQ